MFLRQTKYCCVSNSINKCLLIQTDVPGVFCPLVLTLIITLPRGVKELIENICSINLLRNGPSMPEICFREHRLLFRFFSHGAHHRYCKYLWVSEKYRWDKICNGLVCFADNFPKIQSKSKRVYMHTFLITIFYSLNILDCKQIKVHLLPYEPS